MEPSPLSALAAAAGSAVPAGADPARLVGPAVVIDSRAAEPGALFVALPGERADGHSYVAAAAERGAAAALVAHPVEGSRGLAQLLVPDPLAALADVARWSLDRERGHVTVIGLTGSSGKTTTKDLLAQVLAAAGETVAPENSFNNEMGVPLTALKVGATTRFLVSEMGSRGPGHIAHLAGIVRPEIGVVLNIGHAHAGEFGSKAATAQAKGELIEALPAAGWAVLNAADPLVAGLAARHAGPTAWFSAAGRPDARPGDLAVWAEDVAADPAQRHSFTLRSAGPGPAGPATESADRVTLLVPGRHQVANALAAAAAALAAGLAPVAIAAALGAATLRSHWRLEVHARADGLVVVNDAYNANPDSLAAALETTAGLAAAARAADPRTRFIAVLGDMLELGDQARALHQAAGAQAAAAGVTDLVAVGEFGPALAAGARAANPAIATTVVNNRDDAVSHLASAAPPAIVLVKASRGVGLERVAESLLGPFGAKDGPC
ncbi:MAG: UDP-N-acetylmuramoyl-tripeptide--D-alanyl-D-alanine ligase [Propionibacteriaceae bacterium]|jgi:UDP-N-acetylmuramoyl-tripeptide--D-alanyl-D-alanine ligase|nr:UDP-N-acetylmuramoyl-tripeptide--D-alanyl-D-alanine ligase [Propionibacteriaceae bacterium]